MKFDAKVKINYRVLYKIPEVIAKQGLIRFVSAVKDKVSKFVPEDTSTLAKSSYIIRNPLGIILAFGSEFSGSNLLNKIAIRQHEDPMFHYGSPKGGSMRAGLSGFTKGIRWAINRTVIPISSAMRQQKAQYSAGYRMKKRAGQLTKYPTKFLSNALLDAVAGGAEKFFSSNIINKDTKI